MNIDQTTHQRDEDVFPVPTGWTPRDVYTFAKARADALRAELAGAAK